MKLQSTIAFLVFLFFVGMFGLEIMGRCFDENYDQRQEANRFFAELNDQCPMPINSYIALKSVGYRLGRLEYVYVVNESGRSEVHLGKSESVKNLAVQTTLECPSSKWINDLDISVHHVYQDRDEWQLLSFDVTKEDLTRFESMVSEGADATLVTLPYEDVDSLKIELDNLEHRPSAHRAKNWFNAFSKECPKQISDELTLDYVKFIGTGRIEYRYTVEDDAVAHINIDYRDSIQYEMAKEMKGTRLGDAIMKLDWAAVHVYKTRSGLQVLSYSVTRNELIRVGQPGEDPSEEPDDATDSVLAQPSRSRAAGSFQVAAL